MSKYMKASQSSTEHVLNVRQNWCLVSPKHVSIDTGSQHPGSPAHCQVLHEQLDANGLNFVMKAVVVTSPSFLSAP